MANPQGTLSSGPSLLRRVALALSCVFMIVLLFWLAARFSSGGPLFGLYTRKVFVGLLMLSYLLAAATYLVAGSQSQKEKITRLMLGSASVLIMVGLLELPALLGWVDYSKFLALPESVQFTNRKPWQQSHNRFDPELLFIHGSNLHFRGETQGDLVTWLGIATDRRYPVDVQYDAHGFRNNGELTQAPIVAIGDSFVEAGLVSHADLMTTHLSRAFQCEVANLGQGAYGPQQELMVLRRYALPLRPRVVLWFFFEGNDLSDVPRFERFQKEALDDFRSTSFGDRSLVKNTLEVLAWLSKPRIKEDSREAVRRSCAVRTSPGEKIYFAYPGSPLNDQDLAALKLTQGTLLEAHELAEANSARFLLVYIPTKFRVYRDSCDFPPQGYGHKWQPSDLPQRLEQWSRDHSVSFLDLTPPLQAAAARGELVYFADDGHWNAKGNETVTAAVTDFLSQNGWLAPDSQNRKGAALKGEHK